MCFKRKNERKELLENKQFIQDNAAQIDVLKEYAASEPQLVTLLDEVQDILRYLNPTTNPDAVKIDKKIASLIGDAKITLSKADKKDDFAPAYDAVKELKVLAVERKSVRIG